MSKEAQYWTRVAIVGFVSVGINTILDIRLGIRIGSGRDWLIFFTIMGLGMYFFVIKWAKKNGYGG